MALGAPAGSGAYYALLYHTAAERRAVAACFAFLEELHRDALRLADPTPVVRRLEWWLQQLAPGLSTPAPHPVLVELRALERDPDALFAALAPVVAATMRDVTAPVADSTGHWLEHCRMLAAGPWELAGRHISGDAGTGGNDIATTAARCMQVTQLQEFAPRTSLGRCPIPRECLERHGVAATGERGWLTDPRVHAAVLDAIDDTRRALAILADCTTLPLFCRVLARIQLTLCERMARHPARLCRERPALSPVRKLWIAWLAHRQSGA